jgi:hypothetical protein
MTKDEIFKELESAIIAKKDAEKQIAIAKLKLKFIRESSSTAIREKAGSIVQPNVKETTLPQKTKKQSAVELFIVSHPDLEPEDIEFLRLVEATTQQVADYLTENQIHETTAATVGRHVGKRYQPGPSDSNWKHMVDTVSVIRYHLYRNNGPTKTNS